MNLKTRRFFLLLLLVAIMIVCLKASFGQAEERAEKDGQTNKRTHKRKLERLLDWDSYKKVFRKKYSSMEQQLARQKIFTASAMEVFKTSVKYMAYMLSYYTSINKFSDLTQYEIDELISGDRDYLFENERHKYTSDVVATTLLVYALNDDLISPINVDSVLKKERSIALSKKHKKFSRVKRSFGERRRYFSPDDLWRTDEDNLTVDNNINMQFVIPSNNPNYELQFQQKPAVLMSPGPDYVRVVEDIPPEKIQSAVGKVNGFFNASMFVVKAGLNKLINEVDDQLQKSLSMSASSTDNDDAAPADAGPKEAKKSYINKNTIIIRDWTESGCIGPVRNQEVCNSCYAMSSTGYMEWSLCMNQDRVLTPLSPQYTVSCGSQFTKENEIKENLSGCKYGSSKQAIDFIRDYGLELEANMEYLDYDSECPIPFKTPKKNKGYIRPNVGDPVRLNAKTTRLDLALKVGPVIVSMRVPKNFTDYAGGILDHCDSYSGHSMLIVGNAIENGVEYMLIKNSYGYGWGYNGYLKFKRSALANCVKEFISPTVSFPSGKSKARHIKAYLASKGLVSGKESDDEVQGREILLLEKEFYQSGI